MHAVEGDIARVLVRPLVWSGLTLELGPWTSREVRWRDAGLALVGVLQPGEWIALHWDFACDRLTPREPRGSTA